MAPRPPRGSRPSAPGKAQTKGSGERELSVRVKTASGRTVSSTLWLQRQLNDPYVAAARREGYRSRAAYKLIEMDEKYHLLKKGARIITWAPRPAAGARWR